MQWDDEFAAFVRERTKWLFGLAFSLTGDRHRAADLVQETLCRLYPKWEKVQGSNAPLAYVRKALINQFLTEARRRSATEVPYPTMPEGSDDGMEEATGHRLAIEVPLAKLAPKQRAAVTLHFLHDLTDRDGAQAMECTIAAYRGHLRRALKELRTSMVTGVDEGPIHDGRY